MNQLRKLLAQLLKPLNPYLERIDDAVRPTIAQLRSRYQKLERRERRLVKVVHAVLKALVPHHLLADSGLARFV